MGKRIITILLALCLCITFLSACGEDSGETAGTQASSTGSVSGKQPTSEDRIRRGQYLRSRFLSKRSILMNMGTLYIAPTLRSTVTVGMTEM